MSDKERIRTLEAEIRRLDVYLGQERARLDWWNSHSLDHCVGIGSEIRILDDERIRESIDELRHEFRKAPE